MRLSGNALAGWAYLLFSLPGWVALAEGRLLSSRNPYLLISLLGTPLAAVFLALAAGRLPRTSKAGIALKVSVIGLGFALCGWGSWLGVRLGVEPLMTSVEFCATAASYLALISLALIVAGLVTRRSA